MSKPWVHSISSAKRYGGKPDDYLDIHQVMDSSKALIGDNRHRALTHNAWFIGADGPLEWKFGVTRTNSDGRTYSVRDIGEQHILEDYSSRFIPTAQDWLENLPWEIWMDNGKLGCPPSHQQIENQKIRKEPTPKVITID